LAGESAEIVPAGRQFGARRRRRLSVASDACAPVLRLKQAHDRLSRSSISTMAVAARAARPQYNSDYSTPRPTLLPYRNCAMLYRRTFRMHVAVVP